MTTFWCRSLWDGDPGHPVQAQVLLTVDEGRIATVQVGAPAPPDAAALDGLTVPGIANVHSHAFQRVLRGRTHDAGGTFWTWREVMYAAAARLSPDRYHELARAVYGEMLLAGYTAVGELHYVHHGPGGQPYDDPNTMGEALRVAAADAGIRLTLLDTCYLRAGFDRPLRPEQARFSDGTVERWRARVERHRAPGPTQRIGAAIHSVRAAAPEDMAVVATTAAEHGWPLHAHVSEQPAENDQCRAATGRTPVALLHHCGALGPTFTAVHATHLDDNDLKLLAAAGATIAICPTTERDLADGIPRSDELRRLGLPTCIGSDQHAIIDPFEEIRAIELHERLRSGRRGTHPPAALLTDATTAGYRSLGWPDGGRIEAGALADLVTIGRHSVRLASPNDGPSLAAAVFAASAADVTDVVVHGRHVVRNATHTSYDVAAQLRRALAPFG